MSTEPTVAAIAAFRAETASPSDIEAFIDFRIAQIDEELAAVLAKRDELQAERKRWLSVTGGRSRMSPLDLATEAETPTSPGHRRRKDTPEPPTEGP